MATDTAELYINSVDFVESFDNAQRCSTYFADQEDWATALGQAFPWSEIEETQKSSYELGLESVFDIYRMFLEKSRSKQWVEKTPEERLDHLNTLMNRPHVPQRSTEWYLQTKNVLTASEFSAILGTPRAVGQCALKKVIDLSGATETPSVSSGRLACSTLEMSAMDWGVRFEPVVKQILTAFWSAEIQDVGRLLHPTDPRLAASPDGLIVSAADVNRIGRLLEIKCPIRREMNGKIPHDYWCQMQIQMEVTDIDECDYIEVKLVSPYKESLQTYTPAAEDTLGALYHGKLWLLQDPETLELAYAYTNLELKDFERIGWVVLETIPWHLDSFYTETVTRDRHWYASTAEKREAFWKVVEEVRAGTFVLPASQKAAKQGQQPQQPRIEVCQIED
jgi:putative phage-type endonuclease